MDKSCEYCNFKIKEDEQHFRGEFIIDDCDIQTYLERECIGSITNYYLTSNSYYAGEPSKEVNYCPICGRKLS